MSPGGGDDDSDEDFIEPPTPEPRPALPPLPARLVARARLDDYKTPSVNVRYGFGTSHVYVRRDVRNFEAALAATVRSASAHADDTLPLRPGTPIGITLRIDVPDRRHCDLDNKFYAVVQALRAPLFGGDADDNAASAVVALRGEMHRGQQRASIAVCIYRVLADAAALPAPALAADWRCVAAFTVPGLPVATNAMYVYRRRGGSNTVVPELDSIARSVRQYVRNQAAAAMRSAMRRIVCRSDYGGEQLCAVVMVHVTQHDADAHLCPPIHSLLKLPLDGMQGVVYENDDQITSHYVRIGPAGGSSNSSSYDIAVYRRRRVRQPDAPPAAATSASTATISTSKPPVTASVHSLTLTRTPSIRRSASSASCTTHRANHTAAASSGDPQNASASASIDAVGTTPAIRQLAVAAAASASADTSGYNAAMTCTASGYAITITTATSGAATAATSGSRFTAVASAPSVLSDDASVRRSAARASAAHTKHIASVVMLATTACAIQPSPCSSAAAAAGSGANSTTSCDTARSTRRAPILPTASMPACSIESCASAAPCAPVPSRCPHRQARWHRRAHAVSLCMPAIVGAPQLLPRRRPCRAPPPARSAMPPSLARRPHPPPAARRRNSTAPHPS